MCFLLVAITVNIPELCGLQIRLQMEVDLPQSVGGI